MEQLIASISSFEQSYKNKIAELSHIIDEQTQKIEQQNHQIKELTQQNEEQQLQIEEQQEQIEEHQCKVSSYVSMIETLKKQNKTYQQQIEEQLKQIEEQSQKISSMKINYDKMELRNSYLDDGIQFMSDHPDYLGDCYECQSLKKMVTSFLGLETETRKHRIIDFEVAFWEKLREYKKIMDRETEREEEIMKDMHLLYQGSRLSITGDLSVFKERMKKEVQTIREQNDEKISLMKKETDEKISLMEKEADEKISLMEKEADEKISLIRKEADEKEIELQRLLDKTVSRIAGLTANTEKYEKKIAELTEKIAEQETQVKVLEHTQEIIERLHKDYYRIKNMYDAVFYGGIHFSYEYPNYTTYLGHHDSTVRTLARSIIFIQSKLHRFDKYYNDSKKK